MKEALVGIFANLFTFIHGAIEGIIANPDISYGLAIILFTIVIKVILLPLTIKQTKSSVKLAEVQPKAAELQAKYKNDPQRGQQELLKLYKEENVNPMSGCLPLIIQYPILIALFYAVNKFDYHGAGFLWLPSLTAADPIFILPIVSGVSTYISSKLLQPAQPQNGASAGPNMGMMNIGMAVMFGFMSIKMPSSIVIYWIVNNIIQLIQTMILRPKKKVVVETETKVTQTSNKNNNNKKKKGK